MTRVRMQSGYAANRTRNVVIKNQETVRDREKSNTLHKLPPSSFCHFSPHNGRQKCWYQPSRLHSVITQHTTVTTLQYTESESIIKMKSYNGQNFIQVVIKTTKIFWVVK